MKPDVREKCVVGNGKMHTTAAEATRLAKAVVDGVGMEARVCAGVCPPFPYLALVGEILKGSRVSPGAQNLYPDKEGALTGEVSPAMLLDLGCEYVILGHGERRQKLGGEANRTFWLMNASDSPKVGSVSVGLYAALVSTE
jgi:triosephosphate isomerase